MNTNDRELLETAAKAAGIALVPYTWDKGAPWGEHEGFAVAGEGPDEWNPLESDGDALRLAVALAIDVQLFAVRGTAVRPHDPFARATVDRAGRSFVESATGDAAAATRRAIVRAAAALAP